MAFISSQEAKSNVDFKDNLYISNLVSAKVYDLLSGTGSAIYLKDVI